MESGLTNPPALIRTGAAKGVTSTATLLPVEILCTYLIPLERGLSAYLLYMKLQQQSPRNITTQLSTLVLLQPEPEKPSRSLQQAPASQIHLPE